ncbi:AraC family transcriptional regulator [Nocardia sp. 2]|uniref:AraC family transcriptional regulator n=1 Tax=Nocardia acididurans TaxID=2802282 RepID=A0ABS1MHV2_9NOCA|nr:helix-turn-helix transcriptional regulator [Nocardia acididurans]MBL1080159.1 AraC family transcriptional regulator [Nocardia acididurans]
MTATPISMRHAVADPERPGIGSRGPAAARGAGRPGRRPRVVAAEGVSPDRSDTEARGPGLQHGRLPALLVERLEQAVTPSAALRPWFTEIGYIPTASALAAPVAHVPEAVTTLVLRTEQSGRRDALVLGPRTRAAYARTEAPAGCVRLRLAPGAALPLLGVTAGALTDRILRLSDMPGVAGGFADRLAELDPAELVSFLESRLPRRIGDDGMRDDHQRLLTAATAAMAKGTASVGDLATELAVSERQLRNLFTAGIGVSPKHYARIARVRQVLAAAGNTPWSDIATTTGYFDQSHMTADFRSLMGVTPQRFSRGELPAPAECQAVTALR